ncbi:hypothetical protein CGA22_00800 [Pseudomonas sp. PSB18]|nr:hypothetical protein [Pseudomonas sp. PSB18]
MNATEFNSEFLNIDRHDDISLGQFSHADFVAPGSYLLDITVNQRYFGTRSIDFNTISRSQALDDSKPMASNTIPITRKIAR